MSKTEKGKKAEGKWCLKDFIELKTLGSGAMAVVKKVMHKTNGDVFALKVMSRQRIEHNSMQTHMDREILIHLKLRHPNITRMYGFFKDENDISLLLEYAPLGNLYQHLRGLPSGRLPQAEAIHIFVQVVGALTYLHGLGVAHRDLKPENVLLCEGFVAKVTDFGWCAELLGAGSKRQTFCGTQEYLSPELVSGEDHDYRVDVWSAGVLMYEMLVGQPPFMASSIREAFRRICSVDFSFPSDVSPLARDLIQQLLQRHPGDRLSLEAALAHELINPSSKRLEARDDPLRIKSEQEIYGSKNQLATDSHSTSCVPFESSQALSSVAVTKVLLPVSKRKNSDLETESVEIAGHSWHSVEQEPINSKSETLIEHNNVHDRLSTRAPSSEASSSARSPCNQADQDEDDKDDENMEKEHRHESFYFTDHDSNTEMVLGAESNCEEQVASGTHFGMLLEAPAWATSKMSESMRKVASTMTDTISEITADFDLWNQPCSNDESEQPESQQAHNSKDSSWSLKSWWNPVESADMQGDDGGAGSNFRREEFILGSALIPARSMHWDHLDGNRKSEFTPPSFVAGDKLHSWQPFGKNSAVLSTKNTLMSEQNSNQYKLKQASRFPPTNYEGDPEFRRGRMLPDPDTILPR